MAKKAKAKKSKAKKSNVVRASLSEMARLFEVIAQKPMATANFKTAADKREAFIKLDESTKRFIRRFLTANKMLKKPAAGKKLAAAAMMAASSPNDPFGCF